MANLKVFEFRFGLVGHHNFSSHLIFRGSCFYGTQPIHKNGKFCTCENYPLHTSIYKVSTSILMQLGGGGELLSMSTIYYIVNVVIMHVHLFVVVFSVCTCII